MFVHLLKSVAVSQISKTINANFSSKPEKWDILTAVCLERKPIITPELNDLEKSYKHLLAEIEYERSLKSDHEMRHEDELRQIENLKKGVEVEVHLKQTAQDLLDSCTEELKKFQFSSRITEADKKNDTKSLNRKLDKHLIFVLNQQLGDKSHYILPQDKRLDGETLRQTAERVLKNKCGNVTAKFYGNAPSGFYKYKYPRKVREESGSVGAKVFIYFARLQKFGNLDDKDFKWLDKEELKGVFINEYYKSVKQLLME